MAGTHRLKPDTGIRDCRLQQECHPIRSFHNSVAFLTGAAGGSAARGLARIRRELDLNLSLDAYVNTDADRERLAQWSMKSGQVKMAMYCGDSAGFPAETVFDITA